MFLKQGARLNHMDSASKRNGTRSSRYGGELIDVDIAFMKGLYVGQLLSIIISCFYNYSFVPLFLI